MDQPFQSTTPAATLNWLPLSLFLLAAFSSAAGAGDPFADVQPAAAPDVTPSQIPWWRENLLLRRELYGLVAAGAEDVDDTGNLSFRFSAGFEVQKRFATATKTFASVDYQGRLVYRDHALDLAGDPMGRDAGQWEYETHNAYAELYNLLGPPGRFNLRAGRYYLPFGLNAQTDTHGTLLQLSNDRLFGAERDWQLTAYGNASEHLDYLAGYVFGAGPDQKLDGQAGMAAGRLGLNSDYLYARGLEAGVSGAYGERVDPHAGIDGVIRTWRLGADLRKRIDTDLGPFTLTGEAAAGEDEEATVWSGLAQADWLQPGRRWGAAAQYFYFEREPVGDGHGGGIDERTSAVLTRYFRNDVGSAALHWIALALEEQIQKPEGDEDTVWMAQYYRYW